MKTKRALVIIMIAIMLMVHTSTSLVFPSGFEEEIEVLL